MMGRSTYTVFSRDDLPDPISPSTITDGEVMTLRRYAVNGSCATVEFDSRSRPIAIPSSPVGDATRAGFKISACRVVVGAGAADGAYHPRLARRSFERTTGPCIGRGAITPPGQSSTGAGTYRGGASTTASGDSAGSGATNGDKPARRTTLEPSPVPPRPASSSVGPS